MPGTVGTTVGGRRGARRERRTGDRLRRSDRLGGGPALRRASASTWSASTTTCAATSSAPEASTAWNVLRLTTELGDAYTHFDVDIRDRDGAGRDLQEVRPGHRRRHPHRRPAQPRLGGPGAVHRLRRQRRRHAQRAAEHPRSTATEAPFIHCSTNKVYGDRPNSLPLVELETRCEIEPGHPYADGITEDMSIDHCLHSVFGASKVAADVMVQEYGRYFGMRTAVLPRRHADRPGPLGDRAARLPRLRDALRHGGPHVQPLRLQGQDGPRRDPLATTCSPRSRRSSATRARPRSTTSAAAGSPTPRTSRRSRSPRRSAASEARIDYDEQNRVGDHQWWIGSTAHFQAALPGLDSRSTTCR